MGNTGVVDYQEMVALLISTIRLLLLIMNYNNETAIAENVSPDIFCRSTKILTIKAGHIVSAV